MGEPHALQGSGFVSTGQRGGSTQGTVDGAATRRPRLVHLTTADISLELLLGPQLSAFIDAGYEVIGVSAPGPFVPAIEARGVEHIALSNATRSMAPHKDLLAIGELTRLFRRLRPDIVHTHNPKPGLYGRLAATLARVPVIVNTVHGLYAQPEDSWKRRWPVYGLERLASTCSHAELVQNEEDLETLADVLRIPRRKLTLLGNGIDLDRFTTGTPETKRTRVTVREQLGLAPDAVVVGAVGRLVIEKGYVELLEAWDRVRVTHPTAVLVVVGPSDDDKADSLPAGVIQRARNSGVMFLGMRDDVDDLYHAMDIYVLASHREGFPRSAMEAAACGLPIVATDIRGCRQVVDDDVTGLLVPVRDARRLADALIDLIGNPARRQAMSKAAVVRAAAEFDQRRVIDTTFSTYARLSEAKR